MHTKIIEFIKEKKYITLRKELEKTLPADIAELFDEIESEYRIILFRLLSKDEAAEVFTLLTSNQRKEIIASLTPGQVSNIVDELFFDDMIDLLEEMPANMVKGILANANEEDRKLINEFLRYPENSAGSLMTIEYVRLNKQATVKEALAHIKKTGVDKETIYTCYVTDSTRRLEGTVSLRTLVLAEDETFIYELFEEETVSAHTLDDQEEIADAFKKYDLLSLPVVDNEERLVGIITIDDVVDVIEQENTEDFHKMAAMQPNEETYLETSVKDLALKRLPWLCLLMITATITAFIMESYEEALAVLPILAASVPMLMDTAGNAGAQSSTLVIRGMAVGDVEIKDYYKVIFKEIRVSIVIGIALAAINMLRMLILGTPVMIATTVSLTVVVTIILAKIVGSTLPIIAKKFNMDPAVMAGPLVTTVVDSLALLAYFNIATVLLGI